MPACEHASREIPAPWSELGLEPRAARDHAAWDVGANALALSARRGAPLVAATVSRFVHDANRPPGFAETMPVRVELVDASGDVDIAEPDRAACVAVAHEPFHAALAAVLDWRASLGCPAAPSRSTASAPRDTCAPRGVEVSVLRDEDARLTDAPLEALENVDAAEGFVVRCNEPHGPDDGVTWTPREHALPRSLPNVMLKVRNDLLADAPGVERLLAAALAPPLARAVRDALGPLAHEARGGARVGTPRPPRRAPPQR